MRLSSAFTEPCRSGVSAFGLPTTQLTVKDDRDATDVTCFIRAEITP